MSSHDADHRLAQLLESYGADPSRWPPAERARMRELLDHPNGGTSDRECAERLDAALDAHRVDPPAAHVRARLLAIPRCGPTPTPWHAVGGWRVALTALAASLVLGVAVGYQLGGVAEPPPVDALLDLALLDDDVPEF